MSNAISIAKTLKIRDRRFDEKWLQSQIEADPNILGLDGELRVVERERLQSSGGKIDFLLEDTDDRGMYEVEVMLGETDEAHIIRTIEYWDLERKRWPKRSHTAVLVAESINRRFFNVVQLLSETVPMIAIKVSLIEVKGEPLLHFTTVLDIYQEPDGEVSVANVEKGEAWWQTRAPWTLAHANSFEKIAAPVVGRLDCSFREDAIRLRHDGEVYFRLNKHREANKTSFYAWFRNEMKPSAAVLLEKNGIPHSLRQYDSKWQTLRFDIENDLIQERPVVFRKIAEFVRKSWLT